MKRDMDLQRKILFHVEESYEPSDFPCCEVQIDGYAPNVIKEHCTLLIDAVLLNQANRNALDLSMSGVYVGNLTNAGYDFLDKIRQDTVWNNTKEIIVKKGLPLIPQTIGKIASAIIESTAEGVAKAILEKSGF